MATKEIPETGDQALTQHEYSVIVDEIEQQPAWRHVANKEMDYADGNQLDSELLRKQQELGIPPSVEDLIGPALLSIQGYESKTRTDWRVTASGEVGGQDVADALNYKLNQGERESRADAACSDAFRAQIGCGIGWVEVARESDPFKFPYRCDAIHRNEIHWDMKATKHDLSDARWLRRQRWLTPDRVMLVFPKHKELIESCGRDGGNWWMDNEELLDGTESTGLNNAWNEARAWTMQEDRWYNSESKEICVAEVWYRRWERVPVMKTPDGRVVEFDENNIAHNVVVANGAVKVVHATVARVRRSYWLGPHLLHDGPTPYTHRHFPYVPFWGFKEDMTNVPYGYVRGMKYAQDSLNSGNSKLRWGMSVVRVERTKGAVDMTDAQLRRQIARPDADIVLNADHFRNNPQARFEVKRDYDLTSQQLQLMNDNRSTIQRVSAVTSGFMGKEGTARSGLQEQTQVEQSNQSLARIMDRFREGRTMVGELLIAMIIEDMGSEEQTVVIEGDAVREDRAVVLNKPERDANGNLYLSNDLRRTRLKVALDDVPSTSSYRGQQLNAMSEAVKSLPQEYQAAILPFMVSLMDVPFKRDVVEAVRAVQQQQTPEQIEQDKQAAIKQALADARTDIEGRKVDILERKAESEIRGIDAKSVQVGVQAAFSAMQAGAQIAQMPMIAPIADAVMQGAGYVKPNPMGDDPNFLVPEQTAAMNIKSPYMQGQPNGGVATQEDELTEVNRNTSPAFPPVPQDGASPMEGIETPATADNLPAGAP